MKDVGKITILNKDYKISVDGFGLRYIDGIELDKFLDEASPEVLEYLAKTGLQSMKDNPEAAHDIIERYELPKELEQFIPPKTQ